MLTYVRITMGNCVSGSDDGKDSDMDRSVHGQHYKGSTQKVKVVTSTVPHASRRGYELYRGFEDALGRLLDLDLDLDLDQDTRNTLKEMEPHVWEKKGNTKSHIQNLNAFVQVYEHNTSLSSVIFADRRAGITAMRAFFTYFHFMCDSTNTISPAYH